MSTVMRYAQLRHNTWVYRRTYPRDVQPILGTALKKSLKTPDAREAKARISELNATFTRLVAEVRASRSAVSSTPSGGVRITVPMPQYRRVQFQGEALVKALASTYLQERAKALRPGSYKGVRYGIGLFVDRFGSRPIGSLERGDGLAFLQLLSGLMRQPHGQGTLSQTTQAHLWGVALRFLTWAERQGHLGAAPFAGVEGPKVDHQSYAVLTDDEVCRLLAEGSSLLRPLLLLCLLTGLRSGEALVLRAEEVVSKGNLGRVLRVVPNDIRALKSKAAEREVPVHELLERHLLPRLPSSGPLFPQLSVGKVVKLFAADRQRLNLTREGLVFHSTRKWFVTQCERTGVPEHFTASLVGHQSARSQNRLTYGLYSAGISLTQKREIIDQIRLPAGVVL
ncbi:DUF6538 domain-containing protein [Thioclava sp. A2]|uniref:DUF6538 domain-containing protein n=1 Tax=Thioclava sp. FCG-A2 TaxID=3080562 RepID=UPI002953392A|nr:DUF6538 domain-containing protein [Thioclava sp. A2]MDV7272125.1 DUF6538 domain-containing protein [Thioclava sp. A2]